MNNYIIYNGELYHYGVKGMKWGRRKARPIATGMGRRGAVQKTTQSTNPASAKAARKARAKKALKIGAAAAGTALAAYGAYKLTKFIKKNQAAKARAAATRAEMFDLWRAQTAAEQQQRIASMPGVISRVHSIEGPGGVVDTYKYMR